MNVGHRAAVALVAQLYSQYCFAIDTQDVAGFLGTFAPDARFQIVGGRTLHGHLEIEEIARRRSGRVLHLVSNILVAASADAADDEIYASAYVTMVWRHRATPAGYGFYDDRVVLDESGGARFAHKQLRYVTATEEYRGDLGFVLEPLPTGYRPVGLSGRWSQGAPGDA